MRIVPFEKIRARVLVLRDVRVMLSGDLAELYGVEHRVLLQAMKRNRARFPDDFMFQLDWVEAEQAVRSRSQFVILKRGANVKFRPFAFTEQGVAMLSSVLKSARAIEVNIEIMRAFVSLRQFVIDNEALARQVAALKRSTEGRFKIVFDVLDRLTEPLKEPPRKPIGFRR